MDKILIITGGNKGIGNGIVTAFQQHNYKIFSIARAKNTDPSYDHIIQIEFDLSNTEGLEELLSGMISEIDSSTVQQLTLINNAGTLGQIGLLADIPGNNIAQTVQLNTIAPLILTAQFLKLTQHWLGDKKVINISSGAATKPYHGWTVYCATKAALDMMTKTVALEQKSITNGAKILAIYPGVVDTGMHAQIRTSDQSAFADIDRFLALKTEGMLANQETVGKAIFDIVNDDSLENGSIIRVEDSRS